jgi:DNA primase
MDVVALAQYGFRNTVATSGTATTPQQVEMLFRAADTIIFCFDGDAAGRKAAWRALQSTLAKIREGLQAKFLFLPEGEDPDSMVRAQGATRFSELLDQAMPLSEFFFQQMTEESPIHSLDGRARLVQRAQPYLEMIPEGIFREMMTEKLENLAQHRLRPVIAGRTARPVEPGQRGKPVQKRTPMRTALAHLVQNPELVKLLQNREEFDGPSSDDVQGIEIFRELVDFCAKRPNITTAQLFALWHEHHALPILEKLAVWHLPGDEEIQGREFIDATNRIRLAWVDILLSRITNILEQKEEYRQLQHRQQGLKKQLESPRGE